MLLFHSPVEFQWHPKIRELLLVTCQDEANRSVPFIWDPLMDGPRFVTLGEDASSGKAARKLQATWVNWDADDAAILLSDSHHWRLALLSENEAGPEHWETDNLSLLGLGSARSDLGSTRGGGYDPHEGADDTSLLEDTFSFKHG